MASIRSVRTLRSVRIGRNGYDGLYLNMRSVRSVRSVRNSRMSNKVSNGQFLQILFRRLMALETSVQRVFPCRFSGKQQCLYS